MSPDAGFHKRDTLSTLIEGNKKIQKNPRITILQINVTMYAGKTVQKISKIYSFIHSFKLGRLNNNPAVLTTQLNDFLKRVWLAWNWNSLE
jgi:hypothetical protein